MMLRSISLPLAACLLVGGAVVGCEDDESRSLTGSLRVAWGGSLCSTDGVAQVALSLDGAAVSDPATSMPSCIVGEERFRDLEAGDYELTVRYLDDAGETIQISAGEAPAETQRFDVSVEEGIEVTVRLTADLLVDLPDGGFQDGGSPPPPPPPPPPTDEDEDGIPDLVGIDNCIGTFNPDQKDTDNDEVGDVCDCVPSDEEFTSEVSEAVLDDDLDSDTGLFTVVDGSWSYLGGVYRQSGVDGLTRSWRAAEDLNRVSFETEVNLLGTGSVGTIGYPFVGVAIRSTGFVDGPDAGQAYVCGTDGNVLILGLLDAGLGTISPLQSMGLSFVPTTGVPLGATAKGTVIACRIADPSGEWHEISVVDATLISGATAFITNGRAADFEFARICDR